MLIADRELQTDPSLPPPAAPVRRPIDAPLPGVSGLSRKSIPPAPARRDVAVEEPAPSAKACGAAGGCAGTSRVSESGRVSAKAAGASKSGRATGCDAGPDEQSGQSGRKSGSGDCGDATPLAQFRCLRSCRAGIKLPPITRATKTISATPEPAAARTVVARAKQEPAKEAKAAVVETNRSRLLLWPWLLRLSQRHRSNQRLPKRLRRQDRAKKVEKASGGGKSQRRWKSRRGKTSGGGKASGWKKPAAVEKPAWWEKAGGGKTSGCRGGLQQHFLVWTKRRARR